MGTTGIFTANWQVLLRTREEAKARKIVDRLGERLGVPLGEFTLEPYKDPEFYRVIFSVTLATEREEFGAAVLEVLQLANRLGRRWYTDRPQAWDDGTFWFGGHRDRTEGDFSVPGVEWASFVVSNRLSSEAAPAEVGQV